ncbi:hypothetical protein NLJ89_g1703 [Agrocybe chaxingu]|uniref:DNA ligase n=1 Tax=Agrocybe chaxingu TaxID=84603 RepID=A0A9W8MZJ4_9AGAR|nr:hypothetical protein NLJ89_g1703 [Agrocybe chaxingu]
MQPTPAPSSAPNSPGRQREPQLEKPKYNPPPLNVGSAPFGILVGLFEKLQNERKQDRRRKLIDAWFTHWRQEKGYDLYPVLRLILPQKDRERAVYGLKEKNLAKAYIKLIPLGMRDPDAIRLLNWKKPTEREKSSGDFPTVLFEVVSKRSSVIEGSLSVDDVNDILDELSKSMGKQIHIRVKDKAVQLFHAFAPMLCKRPTRKIEETVREMGGAEFIVEEKLDGERMQLHKRGNEYFYCSRKGKDYTYLYGKHVGVGSLTPYIDKAFDPRVDDIILDGEMLVWDPVSERNLPFGTLKTAALDKSKKEHNPRPCFKVFDLLYLNGQSLLHRSTQFRKKNMRQCLKEITGRIEYAVEYRGKTAKDIRERMDEVMANRGEGLVIKHPMAKYVLNGRNLDWIKVKPEYMDNMGETVDLLVVAGNYGSGKRSGGVSTLICAVFDDRKSYEDDEDPKYSSFVRIGTGLSFADYVWIRAKPWKPWDPKYPPEFLQTAKRGQDDKGDIYLNPEDSFIIKIKAAEITPSDQYHMGYTMRFPRALSIRDDLTIADCMPASAVFESLRSERKRKMESDAGVTKKKRKTTVKKATVLPQYQGPSKKGITVESDIFEGMKFVVMSDPKSRTGEEDKKTITKSIYANGGTCAQIANNQPDLYVVYGGSITPYDLKLVIDKGKVDVLKPSWVMDSIERGEKVPMRKKYFFHATGARLAEDGYDEGDEEDGAGSAVAGPSAKVEDVSMSPAEDTEVTPKVEEEMDPSLVDWFKVAGPSTENDVDEDSVTEPDSDNADIAEPQEEVNLDDWFQVKTEEASTSEKAAGKQPAKAADEDVKMGETEDATEYDQELIFKHLCFYLDSPENATKNGLTVKSSKHEKDINQSLVRLSKLITDNGGKVVDLDEPKLTHIVIDRRDDSRRLELMRRTSKPKRRHLIISDFIQTCLDEGTLLDEEEFVP